MQKFDPIVTEDHLLSVTEAMRDFTRMFITPISSGETDDDGTEFGELQGTGNFVEWMGCPCLCTAGHVAQKRQQFSLAHFSGSGGVLRIVNEFFVLAAPEDVGITKVHSDIVPLIDGKSFLPSGTFDPSFSPVPGELLFVHGFAGEKSRFSGMAGGLMTRSTPFGTTLAELPVDADPEYHAAIAFPTTIKLKTLTGAGEFLPDPHGCSGSFVWDTKFVASGGRNWNTAQARVCGIARGWAPEDSCVVVTRIEYLLKALHELHTDARLVDVH